MRRSIDGERRVRELVDGLQLDRLPARCAVGGLSYRSRTLLTDYGVPFVGTLMIGLLVVALVVGTVWAPAAQR